MTRRLRNLVGRYPAHIVHRGNNRQPIFQRDGDYLFFVRCLADAAARLEVQIHSYVFMTNHVHLLMTPPEATSVSSLMQSVARRYVGYFNDRYSRTGTLWEGRFHSSLITTDAYMLACHRYIDSNPVRAGLTSSPADYPWSSHRHHAYGQPDSLVTAHTCVLDLAASPDTRQLAYRRLFDDDFPAQELEEIRGSVQRDLPLGFPKRQRGRPARIVSDTNLF